MIERSRESSLFPLQAGAGPRICSDQSVRRSRGVAFRAALRVLACVRLLSTVPRRFARVRVGRKVLSDTMIYTISYATRDFVVR